MTAPRYKEGQGIALAQVHAQVRRLRRWLLLVAVLAAFGAFTSAWGLYRAGQATDNNCVRIHRIVAVGNGIIADRDAQGRPGKSLRQFRDDGLLSETQFQRALAAQIEQLKRWRSADCPAPPPEPEETP
jgi:hypothetical protein